jgi:hypothetical protein
VNARAVAAAALAAMVLLAPGCHERRSRAVARAAPALVGSYKGYVDTGDGKQHRFRLLLWAELPDRLHAEFLPPVGGPAVIVDAGDGRLAVTLARERTAYVGAASEAAIGAVTGVAVPLEEMVRWIVSGAVPGSQGDPRVARRPESGPGLPEMLEIRSGGRTLRIERRGIDAQASLAEGTGTGIAPRGVVEKPIEELPEVGPAADERMGPQGP